MATSFFYDKAFRRLGAYREPKHISEYPDRDPDEVFKENLLAFSGSEKVALDVGCFDGRFTLSVAPYFKKIVAIDLSREALAIARKHREETRAQNVSFEEEDAHRTTYEAGSFDVVYSRRGPSDCVESFRLLRPGGHFIEIKIGEKDTQEIKEIFGRGQDFGKWTWPRIRRDEQELEDAGFEVAFAQEFFYGEYYRSFEDLDLFLQGVPIFEDFDSELDKTLLETYSAKFQTEKGIKLPRHRVVVVARKASPFSGPLGGAEKRRPQPRIGPG